MCHPSRAAWQKKEWTGKEVENKCKNRQIIEQTDDYDRFIKEDNHREMGTDKKSTMLFDCHRGKSGNLTKIHRL